MTPEVRERIEQIKNGEVPEGYKSSINGIIPDKWEIKKLSNLLSFKNGINADKEKFGKGTKLISVRDILSDKPIMYDSITGLIDVTQAQLDEFSVTYGDILFQRSSENYEDAGTSNVYLDTNRAVFSGFVIRGKKISEYDPIYLNAVLKTAGSRKNIIRLSAGAQHINIGQESLSKVQIPMAPSTEQQKIAEILTTQDKVIELKEKLIAEKKRQKKYLMQQLLTGKTRLTGFNKVWESIHLKDIVQRCSTRNTVGNTNVLTISAQYGLINQEEFFNKSIAGDDKSTYYLLQKNDFAYNKSYSKGYPFGAIKRLTRYEMGIVSPLYICFRLTSPNVSTDFLESCFEAGLMNHEILAFAQEGARNHGLLNIAVGDFFNSHIVLPELKEQLRISEILSTAGREIEILQQDLEQEKLKKKALMQLLLTGIVRV